MAAAYANSWAVVYTLVQTAHAAFRRIARTLQQRQVLRKISRDDELKEIASALGRSLSDIESDVNALLKSLPRRRR